MVGRIKVQMKLATAIKAPTLAPAIKKLTFKMFERSMENIKNQIKHFRIMTYHICVKCSYPFDWVYISKGNVLKGYCSFDDIHQRLWATPTIFLKGKAYLVCGKCKRKHKWLVKGKYCYFCNTLLTNMASKYLIGYGKTE